MNQLVRQQIWSALKTHAADFFYQQSESALKDDTAYLSACQIHLDYTKQLITPATLKLLFDLAESCQLADKIHALMRGDKVNHSENRPALHTALRSPGSTHIQLDNRNVTEDVMAAQAKMQTIASMIRNKQWLGYSGKAITDIVNIGIGGSDLGPRFCIEALHQYASQELGYHFISDAEPMAFASVAKRLQPDTTLFIVSSKSFTTRETLYNARKAIAWVGNQHLDTHFIAVTAKIEKALEFGFKNILPIWDWVGGRYSFCSAINLISAIAIGFEHFQQILQGAHQMDLHFKESELKKNLPVMLALLGVWNNNFLSIHNHLILTYAKPLDKFVPYIQQLDMESNGKSIDNQGNAVNYATGPIIWGGPGNQAQHSYYQLLCQGTHKITADFITLDSYADELINQLAKAKMNILTAGVREPLHPNGFIPGNVPLNHIRLEQMTPFTLGALVAMYEHKIFTQSIIWNINAFDQPGVESAKHHAGLSTRSIQNA